MQVKMAGSPMNLVGAVPAVGSTVPSFTVVAGDLSAVTQADLKGNRVFITVPSIDTPVCDTEVRRFNKEAAALGNVSINVISMDLPFAQARWCGAAGIDAVKLYSDYKDRAFGKAFGVMIEELGLLARAIFIVDEKDVVRYVQVVEEVTSEPNYDEVLATLKTL
ncbi:MAG: thiol peroxidase [Treponema sp.]|nr:thiol peroxidase [Spirochaetaceae bacterium]MDD7274496.1 thiol peroxidase [Treponema sp.]